MTIVGLKFEYLFNEILTVVTKIISTTTVNKAVKISHFFNAKKNIIPV